MYCRIVGSRSVNFLSIEFTHAFQHPNYFEAEKAILSLSSSLPDLPQSIRSLFKFLVDGASLLLHPDRCVSEMNRWYGIHARNSLYESAVTNEAVRTYNICLALLQQGKAIESGIVWARYWNIDIMMIGDKEWLQQRLQENERAVQESEEPKKYLLLLDSHLLLVWRDLFKRKGLMGQVLAMEVYAPLYHIGSSVCSKHSSQRTTASSLCQ